MKYLRAAALILALIVDAVLIVLGVFLHPLFLILAALGIGIIVAAALSTRDKKPSPPPINRDPVDVHFGEAMQAWDRPWPVNLVGMPATLREAPTRAGERPPLTPRQRELAAEDARAKRLMDGLGDR